MNEHITTVQTHPDRWAVLEDALPIGAIGTTTARVDGYRRRVWVVLDAGSGVDITALAGTCTLNPADAVDALLEARTAAARARTVPGLPDGDRRLLDFERAHWQLPYERRARLAGARFGLTEGRYLQRLNSMVNSANPAYREYAADVITRLERIRAYQLARGSTSHRRHAAHLAGDQPPTLGRAG